MKTAIVILSAIVAFLLFDSYMQIKDITKLQERVGTLENNGKHYLHRLNAIQYPEVLGKTKKKKYELQ